MEYKFQFSSIEYLLSDHPITKAQIAPEDRCTDSLALQNLYKLLFSLLIRLIVTYSH